VASSEAKQIYKTLASGNFCAEANEGILHDNSTLFIDIYLPPSPNEASSSDQIVLLDPSEMKVSAIKKELQSCGVDCTPYVDKSELVAALIDARKNPPARSSSRGEHIMKIACISGVMGGREFTSFGHQTHYNTSFHTIPKEAVALLSDRVIHSFLRLCGSKILPRVWVAKIVRIMIEGRYGASQLHLAMDIAACAVDIYCSEGGSDRETDDQYWGEALTEAGEAFEAGGKWFAAKDTYVLAADGPFSPKGPLPERHCSVLGYAGLAVKRAGDSTRNHSERMGLFYQAEELYIRAWSHSVKHEGGLGDLNSNAGYCAHLTNVMVLYDQISEETPVDPSSATVPVSGRGLEDVLPADCTGGHEAKEDEAILFLLSALLYLAGLRNVTGRTRELVLMNGPQHVGLLHDEYRIAANARNLLEEALKVPSKRHFRDKIMQTKDTAIVLVGKKAAIRADRPVGENVQDRVRETFESTRSSSTKDVFGCDGPACTKHGDDKMMKSCPCKAAHYCGIDCQSKDWPTHKKICSYHKKRLAAKKRANEKA
jgi:hypothetical protein